MVSRKVAALYDAPPNSELVGGAKFTATATSIITQGFAVLYTYKWTEWSQ